MARTCPRRLAGLVLCALLCGWPGRVPASPATVSPERRAQLRARAGLIRACIATHQSLVQAKLPLPLPPSDVLPDTVAAGKTYGASWTCRSSTGMLSHFLTLDGRSLTVDSSGANTFRWGKEGLVSYHYYGVDDPRRPSVLVDPTAATNYGRDAKPGGLLHLLLGGAGRDLGYPRAAEAVAGRIVRAGDTGLLVLANPAEIAVYRGALERAAQMCRGAMTRDAERDAAR